LYELDAEACHPFLAVKSNPRYLSLPTGLELEPFLQTLRLLSAGGSRLSLRTLKRLETFLIATGLEACIAPACPHCPALVVLCGDLALAGSYLEVSIVDVTLFPEQVRGRGIRAIATLVINGEERLVGAVGEAVFVDRFINRELAAFHSETFRRILKEGDARKFAATMLAKEKSP
jgi:alkyl hydroperoxide reductase subunit AhpF